MALSNAMSFLIAELILDRSKSADIPYHTTEIIDKIEEQFNMEISDEDER